MPHHIKELFLDSVSGDFDITPNNPERRLGGLSKINLFVGPNNSGKSRFLRELAKIEAPHFVPERSLKELRDWREYLVSEIRKIISGNIADIDGLKASAESLPAFDSVTAGTEPFKVLHPFLKNLTQARGGSVNFSQGIMRAGFEHMLQPLRNLGTTATGTLENILKPLPNKWEFERIYIPTLRGLRPFEGYGDVYQKRTHADYFTTGKHPEIATGLQLYSYVESLLLGDLKQRRIVSRFESFLSETFFEKLPVAIIPRKGKDVLFIKIGNETEQPIFNLGDGIQMIIAIMLPLFVAADKNVLLFIEEPELYLHPGLQRTLVNALGRFENAQCFIATHSNHLLDLTTDRSDISIFSVRKELGAGDDDEKTARCHVENLSNADNQILNMLGVRNSSVFLSNCTIWVEGVTDRRYIRRFLTLYIRHKLSLKPDEPLPLKEDLHYSFVEYGGSNITHWSFLDSTDDPIVVERLCSRLMLIADKDDSKAKDERHAKLASKLKDRFFLLNRREIENLLTPTTIRSVVAEYEKSNDHMAEISYESYAMTPLGSFIEDTLLKGQKKRKGSYKEDSGTIDDKNGFCERALTHIRALEDLSVDAQKLAERIYEFISKQNPI